MKKKQQSGYYILAGVILAAALASAGCNSGGGDGDGPPSPSVSGRAPEKPVFDKVETGFEYKDSVNLKTVTDADASNAAKMSAVVSLSWKGNGAQSFNIYMANESSFDSASLVTAGITDLSYMARDLQAETPYYFWVEAVNPAGSTKSDVKEKRTGKPGPQSAGGLERGDYPRDMQVIPGDRSLTVTWAPADRVGWYEVYYAPVGSINHVDITHEEQLDWSFYTGNTFDPDAVAYEETVDTNPNLGLIPADNGATPPRYYTGKTQPITPYNEKNWRGFWIGPANGLDPDTRLIRGLTKQSGDPNPTLDSAKFYHIKEIWKDNTTLPTLVPYKPLASQFSGAIPWKGAAAGTAGTPVKYYKNTVTITGLTNNTAYEVWVRAPNTNGERGYGYVTGTPSAVSLGVPSGLSVTTPANTMRELTVKWNKVSGADKYRLYTSKYEYTPNAAASYISVTEAEDTNPSEAGSVTYLVTGLDSATTYYVWVLAEKNGVASAFGSPKTGVTGTAPASGHTGDKVIAGKTAKVKTAVYIELNKDNPLNAGSYILDDGTYLFDYVILFAANIRNRNCTQDSDYSKHQCSNTGGLHVHLNENFRYILANKDKYIKPLQDKGIKVILGLLGDHDGVAFSTMSDAEIDTFINGPKGVKAIVNQYGLDGVDFDDEWGSKEDWNGWTNDYGTISPNSIWTYPQSVWGWPTSVTVYRDPTKGVVAGNGTKTATSQSDMNAMWLESGAKYFKTISAARSALGSGKSISLYEYNSARYITPTGNSTGISDTSTNGTATRTGLTSLVDFALQPWYNQYLENSANGIPHAKYSPFGMDLGGEAYSGQNGAPNPPIVGTGNSEDAANAVKTYARNFKSAADPYGMLYFYALNESSKLLKRQSTDSKATVTKESYISIVTKEVFGKNTVLTAEGGDYRKDW